MGEDGYFTHKYFSVSPDRLVLQEDSFQFKFVFTSLTSSNSADQHKHRSHRFRTCCVVFRHLLTLCFSSEARLYASVALIDALPSGSLYNWRPPPPPSPSQRAAQMDSLQMSFCHSAAMNHTNTSGSSAVHHHTLYDHTTRQTMIKSRCSCMHIEALSHSVSSYKEEVYSSALLVYLF